MVTENPSIVEEQRAMYESMCSTRTIREWWRLRVNEAERKRMFEEIAADANTEAAHAIADGKVANVGNSALFASGRNDHEARPSTSIVSLTSTDKVHGQAADSGEE